LEVNRLVDEFTGRMFEAINNMLDMDAGTAN
jgi:hypothetical protein